MKRNRYLILSQKYAVSANLIRLVFTGSELADFPVDQESGYVKLLFPPEGEHSLDGQRLDDKSYFKQVRKRTLTIHAFDADKQELHLDGVTHSFGNSDQGPASCWMEQAEPGNGLWLSGPGEKKLIQAPADWYFLAGDMTALPAIAINLEQLPADAQGLVVIEVMSEADIVDLIKPDLMAVHWVINPTPKTPNRLLAERVRELSWLDGSPAVWVAGEFEMMRDLRRYFKQEKHIDKHLIYASSYWKIGESDEGNKRAKQLDEQGAL